MSEIEYDRWIDVPEMDEGGKPSHGRKEMKKLVNVDDYYGTSGKYLSVKAAETAQTLNEPLKITEVTVEEFKDGKRKLALHFEEIEHILILNKTNASILSDDFGKETDDWVGKTIKLVKIRSSYGGEPVDALQVTTSP